MCEDQLFSLGAIEEAGRSRSYNTVYFDRGLFSLAAQDWEGRVDHRCGGGDESAREEVAVAGQFVEVIRCSVGIVLSHLRIVLSRSVDEARSCE